MNKYRQKNRQERIDQRVAAALADKGYEFLKSLLIELNEQMDRRLVETLLRVMLAIIGHRDRQNGLLLSELGGYILSPRQAPAGTKRISNLLHSGRWHSTAIESFLWQQADERVQHLRQAGECALVIWDESVLEKPESIALDGLGPVRSTKAVRLKRIKPGYFNPPGGRPIFVPGINWLQVLVLGMTGPPTVAQMRWWTTRGEQATDKRTIERQTLAQASETWGNDVIHVWDRGFAGTPWLTLTYCHAVRFVMRWPKHYRLLDENGQLRKAWKITRGKRSWDHRLLWDARRRCRRKTGIIAVPVSDPTHEQPLYLVVVRPGQGREPWYLLTNEPIRSIDEAWQIALIYARRWQVEMAIRFTKCDLAFECPRLRQVEPRHKLLLIATLAYAFLLSLLTPQLDAWAIWLLQHWCPRTGERNRKASVPLYRLRLALSALWRTYPPPIFDSS
jgi:hypothetical protein